MASAAKRLDAAPDPAAVRHPHVHATQVVPAVLLLAGAPGPLTNWKIRHNLVRANNKTDCGEEDPVPSGMGILLLGAADNDISRNLVLGNRGEGVEGLGGGIVLVTGGEPGGPQIEPSGRRCGWTNPMTTSL